MKMQTIGGLARHAAALERLKRHAPDTFRRFVRRCFGEQVAFGGSDITLLHTRMLIAANGEPFPNVRDNTLMVVSREFEIEKFPGSRPV